MNKQKKTKWQSFKENGHDLKKNLLALRWSHKYIHDVRRT